MDRPSNLTSGETFITLIDSIIDKVDIYLAHLEKIVVIRFSPFKKHFILK